MQTRKKRSLLARIEGQLAALERGADDPSKRRQTIQQAVSALAVPPLDATEAQRLSELQQHLGMLLADDTAPAILLAHRNTLARMDCLLWQFHLDRADKSTATAAKDEAA